MKKFDVVKTVLGERLHCLPVNKTAKTFAPTNIALCKYWGKRNQELNLPVTSSLSISLGNKGAALTLKVHDHFEDIIALNNQRIKLHSSFGFRLIEFLNLFRNKHHPFLDINIVSNIPIAAGLA